MSEWAQEPDTERLKSVLGSIYMMARLKRVVTFNYTDDVPRQIGPHSQDDDWDKVIELCENVGLRATLVYAAD